MTNNRPLILVEDDLDDQEMISLALNDLGCSYELKIFRDAETALEFLYSSPVNPFLIVSDINMPKMDGLDFKEAIESSETLKHKSIPFVFLSTAASHEFIERAYQLKAQGFFEKGTSFEHLRNAVGTIISYWERSKQPN